MNKCNFVRITHKFNTNSTQKNTRLPVADKRIFTILCKPLFKHRMDPGNYFRSYLTHLMHNIITKHIPTTGIAPKKVLKKAIVTGPYE